MTKNKEYNYKKNSVDNIKTKIINFFALIFRNVNQYRSYFFLLILCVIVSLKVPFRYKELRSIKGTKDAERKFCVCEYVICNTELAQKCECNFYSPLL